MYLKQNSTRKIGQDSSGRYRNQWQTTAKTAAKRRVVKQVGELPVYLSDLWLFKKTFFSFALFSQLLLSLLFMYRTDTHNRALTRETVV
jgi:hypothetical protein